MSIKTKLTKVFELPPEAVLRTSRVVITGKGDVLIEGYDEIFEYTETKIRLRIPEGILEIHGFNLYIRQVTLLDIVVEGKISIIAYK